jgi:hypothetical protein
MSGIGGSWAEDAFRAYGKAKGFSVEKYGFDNAKLKSFKLLPSFVRHTPDFACTHKKESFLVECKGAGRGNYVNIKLEDMETLREWDLILMKDESKHLYLFINDSDKKKVSLTHFFIIYLNKEFYEVDKWHDGVEFYKVPKSMFTWEERP